MTPLGAATQGVYIRVAPLVLLVGAPAHLAVAPSIRCVAATDDHAPNKVWRAPTQAEREVAERWVAAWNASTGDFARVTPALLVRTSCPCGCPSFAAKPVTISKALADHAMLTIEGEFRFLNGDPAAGLIVWAQGESFDEDEIVFEIDPYTDVPVTLPTVTFAFD